MESEIAYTWPWRRGDQTGYTEYWIVCEGDGTMYQENQSTNCKRPVRRLAIEETTQPY